MDDIIRGWLHKMFTYEIENTQCDLENEMVWSSGSPNTLEEEMHLQNVQRMKKYIKILENMREAI